MDKQLEQLTEAHRAELHRAPANLVAEWHSTIDDAAARERARTANARLRWHPGSIFRGIAVAATLALGIGIGYFLSGNNASIPHGMGADVVGPGNDASFSTVAFSRGLQAHLRDSSVALGTRVDGADKAMLILRIVEQNRLFETAAEHHESPQLARLLRAFEPILLRLAANDIAPEDAEALRAQLAFELNVMLTKIASETSDDSQTT